jgi:hypothetical protein
MRPDPYRYSAPRVPTDLRRLVRVATPNPLVVVWRWRYELTLATGLTAGIAVAISSFGAVMTMVVAAITTLTVLCWPTARQFATDRAWCIITPHRVRLGCTEGLIYSSRGKIPVVLWTSHRAFGERVLLWCRAGTSVDDFMSARAALTAACWAQDVAVHCDTQHAQLITLQVIRRATDPISDDEGLPHGHPGGSSAWPGRHDL